MLTKVSTPFKYNTRLATVSSYRFIRRGDK